MKKNIPMPRSDSRHPTSKIPLTPGFYIFIVEGGIDPRFYGPRFRSAKARDRYMKEIYPQRIDEDNGDLPCWLNLSAAGRPTMGYYAREEFIAPTDETSGQVSQRPTEADRPLPSPCSKDDP